VIGPEEIPVPGVLGLDHTADVGLEIFASDLPELFRRAALGAMWLVLERLPSTEGESHLQDQETDTRVVELAVEELDALFRSWLRTVLYWEDADGFVVVDAELMLLHTALSEAKDGQGFGLTGHAMGRVDQGPRVREIKGVTLHGLEVGPKEEGWWGRVIFDV
jgi:SHS2 domain-containing protein